MLDWLGCFTAGDRRVVAAGSSSPVSASPRSISNSIGAPAVDEQGSRPPTLPGRIKPAPRGSEDHSDARDSGCSTPAASPLAQIQHILATCCVSPAGPGPLNTLSRAALNAACQSLDVSLALVVFEDAENDLVAQQSSGLAEAAASSSFTSFQMQAHPWHFMFKVRCVWVNAAHVQTLGASCTEDALQHISATANKNTAMRCDLMGLLKGIEHGQSQAIKTWNTYYQHKDMDLAALWLQPCLWSTADGSRFIACLMFTEPQPSQSVLLKAMAQDHMCLESIPYSVTTVNDEGMICSQNAAARASFGAFLSVLHDGRGINFLEELFYGHPDLQDKMHRQLLRASSFQVCIQLLSPLLREWLNLEEGDEVWHQLYITRVAATGPKDPAYVIVQPDITDMVVTERKVAQLQQQHQGLLKEILPPEVMEAILHSKMMQDAAPAMAGAAGQGRMRDAQEFASYLDEQEHECEDADSGVLPTSRSSHALPQLGGSAPSQPAMLRSMPRCRRPSQLVANETQSTANLASQDGMHLMHPTTSSMPHLQDRKGIWLTQQDVQNLATNHESVTILFADIKGFTALSQTLHPAEVMLFLNQLYSIWDAMLDSFGVYKVETIGDSYMVAGGLFSIDPDTRTPKLGGYDPRHAQRVLDFGRAMLESASLVLDPRGDPVQIRIGIHSGACVSGVVGQRMPRFCLFGDTINTASRMESTCPRPGCIHASGASQELLQHEPWVATGGVFCKGKGVMQSYYIHVAADSMSPEQLAEEQKLLLPVSLLVAGASEAPTEHASQDELSRAQSMAQLLNSVPLGGAGNSQELPPPPRISDAATGSMPSPTLLPPSVQPSYSSYISLQQADMQPPFTSPPPSASALTVVQEDCDEGWHGSQVDNAASQTNSISHSDNHSHHDDYSHSCRASSFDVTSGLCSNPAFVADTHTMASSSRSQAADSSSCASGLGMSDLLSASSTHRSPFLTAGPTASYSSHAVSHQSQGLSGTIEEGLMESLPMPGMRVRAHVTAHTDSASSSAGASGSGGSGIETMSDPEAARHSPTCRPSRQLSQGTAGLSTSSLQHRTSKGGGGRRASGPEPISSRSVRAGSLDVQNGGADFAINPELLAGFEAVSAVSAVGLSNAESLPLNNPFNRGSPTSPHALMPNGQYTGETPPGPITPAPTSTGRRSEPFNANSYDSHGRGNYSSRPNLGRLSTVAEQAQRVLQELHQSRPKAREFIKQPNPAAFDRRGSIEIYRRGSIDVHRVVSDIPHRGSLDLAWASVDRFRRSQSPRPVVLHEYPDQSSGNFAI